MYQALYRAYRPEVFDQVLGQEHVVRILKNQIKTGSTSHAYLFCGTRGTGKTTSARLLAKGLNCLSDGERPCGECANCRAIRDGNFIDVIEIDAASNNSVDNIRDLRESVNYPPAVGRKKIYIIDEVHMLSSGAFNALLKTLEEPPEYVTFILATTEIHKLPATILSRCMRLDFKRVPEKVLAEGMAGICEDMGIEVSEDALRIIAANSDGSVRDGLSILDQCISGGDKVIGEKDVLDFLGASGEEDFIHLTELTRKKETAAAIEFLGEILADGKDIRQFIRDWITHYRNLLMTKFIREPSAVLSLSAESIERIGRQSQRLETEEINEAILELSKTSNDARWSTQPRILLELAIVKLCRGAGAISYAQSAPKSEGHKPLSEDIKYQPEVNKQQAAKSEPVQEHRKTVEQEDTAAELYTSEESFDCDRLWDEIFLEGENIKGSFFLIRTGGRLEKVGENDFTITAATEIKKNLFEKDRELIETLMEKKTGKRRTMKVVVNNSKKTASAEEIARNASEALGIHIDIE